MNLEAHRDLLKRARVLTAQTRSLRAELERESAKLADAKFSPAYQAEGKQKIREAARLKAAQLTQGAFGELDVAVADRVNWTRERIIRKASRFTLPPDAPVTADRAILSDIREQLTAQRWLLQAPHMSETELVQTFEAELLQRHFAICATLLREADGRAARNAASADGADARALPLRLHGLLNAAALPEFAETETLFAELSEVNGYLRDAVDALDTGDDAGARRQQIVDLRRAGATNDEINAAMAALRAA